MGEALSNKAFHLEQVYTNDHSLFAKCSSKNISIDTFRLHLYLASLPPFCIYIMSLILSVMSV